MLADRPQLSPSQAESLHEVPDHEVPDHEVPDQLVPLQEVPFHAALPQT